MIIMLSLTIYIFMKNKNFKKVLIFMPYIGIGGVEKNLFIISLKKN